MEKREIKLRYYFRSKMFSENIQKSEFNLEQIAGNDPDHNKEWELIDRVQITGLKDKKGREIYEGDIVKNASGRIGEVCYHRERASFIFRDTYNEQLFQHFPLEIIGNIYENSELIKK